MKFVLSNVWRNKPLRSIRTEQNSSLCDVSVRFVRKFLQENIIRKDSLSFSVFSFSESKETSSVLIRIMDNVSEVPGEIMTEH